MKDKYLQHYCNELKIKRGKTPTEKWSGRDFQEIADDIYKKTSVKLSINTIKRVLGIIRYEGNPALSTRNTLVQYLGYKDWDDYLQTNFGLSLSEQENNKKSQHAQVKKNVFKSIRILSIAAIIISLIIILIHTNRSKKPSNSNTALITIDTTLIQLHVSPTEGTVPFPFMVSYSKDSRINDSLILHADNQESYPLLRDSMEFLFTYLYPGKYNINIQYQNQIIKQKRVKAFTKEWMGMVYREPNTIYTYDIYKEKDVLSFPDSIIKELERDNQRYYISFNHFDEFGISGDNLRIKTRYRNIGGAFPVATGNMFINLFCNKGTIKNGFINKGMVRYLQPIYAEHKLSFQTHDLHHFEKEDQEWIDAEIITNNQRIKIFRSDSLVFAIDYQKPLGTLYGIQYFFVGNGIVDYISIWNGQDSLLMHYDF